MKQRSTDLITFLTFLESLAGREDSIWKKVDEFIDTKQPAKYDEAVKLLVDLRDLNKKNRKETAFNEKTSYSLLVRMRAKFR